MYVLVLWTRGMSPARWWQWSVGEEPASLGPTRCQVHPSIVDDGVLHVCVHVASAAQARRLREDVALRCSEDAGMTLEGAWIFPSPARSPGRRGESPRLPGRAVRERIESRR